METSQIAHRYNLVEWALDERLRRLFSAAEAKVLGHGGITGVAAATGVSRRAMHAGLKELESRQTDERAIGSRIRRHGAGRKRVTETDTTLQANKKTLEGTSHPDRNAQFEYINAHVRTKVIITGKW